MYSHTERKCNVETLSKKGLKTVKIHTVHEKRMISELFPYPAQRHFLVNNVPKR